MTITNPAPAAGDAFGYPVAAMGKDRMLIGAYGDDLGATNAGAVYLFSTNGTLLMTFTNPTPAVGDWFGRSIAALGHDRVLIGAYADDRGANNAGAAYLFNTNGTLLVTLTNPTPASSDSFGWSVAAVGSDRILIGAQGDNTGAADAGAAYLFDTNGMLLTTFTNPTPEIGDWFGYSVAGLGPDCVLVGATHDKTSGDGAGAAYLFRTNGVLLKTFVNPAPPTLADADWFGYCVTAIGNDQVLVGAAEDNAVSVDGGAAYLFSTNGTLLTTFTKPNADYFGSSAVAMGSDRVLIGAYGDNTGATDAGAAYLFSTNGSFLTTFTNPTPSVSEYFGASVAVVGNNQVLIGAYLDDTAADNAGLAYLFSFVEPAAEPPSLIIEITTTNTVAISWSSPSTGWTLQENTTGVSSVNWSNAPGPIQNDGTNKTLIIHPPTGNRFYRLFKP